MKVGALLTGLLVTACTAGTPTPTELLPTTVPPEPQWNQVLVIGGALNPLFGPNRVVWHDGQVYVTEFGNGRLLVGPEGGELVAHTESGLEPGQLAGPTGLAVASDGTIYVGEASGNRVQLFSPSVQPIAVWGQFGVDPGEFGSAMGIAVNEDLDRVYVADHVNSRVHVYNGAGELLFMFPRNGDFTHIGDEPDQMWLPIGVGIAGDHTVLVVDSGNRRVQRFSPDGEIIAVYPTSPLDDPQTIHVEGDGSFWIGGVSDGEVGYYGADGAFRFTLPQPAEGFRSPHGIHTEGNRLWVADTGNNVIRVYEYGAPEIEIPPVFVAPMTPSSELPPDVFVEMFSFGYSPPTLTITAGQTVKWTNTSTSPHTATVAGLFDSGAISAEDSFAYTFDEPGTYDYFCTIHGAAIQSGVVIVKPSG